LAVSLSPANAADTKKPTVAVMPLAAKRLEASIAQVLTDMLTLALRRSGRYEVMSADDVNRLLQQETLKDALGCDNVACAAEIAGALGTEFMITGNALKLGNKITITLTLFDTKNVKVIKSAGASVANDEDLFERAMLNALGDLLGAPIDPSASAGASRGDMTIGETPTTWSPDAGAEHAIVEFTSDPPGAVVMLDGRMLCQDTAKGCSKAVAVGAHNVSMQKDRYLDRAEVVAIKKGAKVSWKLTPSFGWLSVASTPPGLDVAVNGKVVGKSPIDRLELAPGAYEVLTQSPCYLSAGKKVEVIRDETKAIEIAPTMREGAINVTAEDKDGNALEADVIVDGVWVGTAPGVFKVGVCAKRLEVRHTKHGAFNQDLSLSEMHVTVVRAVIGVGPSGEVQQPGTKLLWLRCRHGKIWNGTSCEGQTKKMRWEDAPKACPEGYRVPTVDEYKTLLGGCSGRESISCTSCSTSPSCSSMFGSDAGVYWSSSSCEGALFSAWFISFGDGSIGRGDKYHADYHVRCIRRSK
jgi:TolB-like protein